MATFVAGGLILISTFYDIHLRKRETQKKQNGFGDVKVDIGISEKIIKNGKRWYFL